MRILALIFALIGAAGAGFVGLAALKGLQEKEAELTKDNTEAKAKLNEISEVKNLKMAIYGLIAGIPLGVIGGILALSRKGLFAAVLLILTYAIPFVILATGVGIDFSDKRVQPILLFPAGFLIAAFFSLFVRKKKLAPADGPGISEDDDLVG